MKTSCCAAVALVLAVLAFGESSAKAAEVPAAPPTLFNLFGIPQGVNKAFDAVVNRKGKHPGLERGAPVLALAAPENLESEVPAIKVAAQIKADEDLQQQKIKGIRYLASVGCECHEGVKEALLASLDDCDEEVRFEAAQAFCQTAGNPCKTCNSGSCCGTDVVDKLSEMAYGRDDTGCCFEPSARVRQAAQRALNACRRMSGSSPFVPDGREHPVLEPSGDAGAAFMGDDGNGGVAAQTASYGGDVSFDSVSLTRFGQGGCTSCSSGGCATCDGSGPCGGGAGTPGAAPSGAGPLGGDLLAGGPGGFGETFGAMSGPQSMAPSMIGDSYFGGLISVTGAGNESIRLISVPIAGGDRRFKIAENNSPIPVDRVFFNYNHFQDALQTASGSRGNLDRFTFGVEKTFFCGRCSAELRVPFASGLNSDQSYALGSPLTGTEFGNISFALKGIVRQTKTTVLSVGLGMVFPTGDDGRVIDEDNEVLTMVKNEAFHLQPFVGYLWTPGPCWFLEAFAQLDFDTNGNGVVRPAGANNSLQRVGVLQDQNLAMLDLTVGRWIYRNRKAKWIRGIAPMVELHYTSTIQDADFVGLVGNRYNRMDALNITGGLHFQVGARSQLRVAAVAPLRTGSDAFFPAEVSVQFNRRY